MKGTFETLHQASLWDIPNVISLPESGFGRTLLEMRVGPTNGPSGPDHAHANLSHRQACERGLTTSGTCGLLGSGSSSSSVLAASLASRLRPRMRLLGSTLYRLTWKVRTTPSGRLIYALRGLAHPKSGNGFSMSQNGWPTTRSGDSDKGVRTLEGSESEIDRKGSPQDLCQAAQMAGWPTSRSNDSEKRGIVADGPRNGLVTAANLSGWQTPKLPSGGGQEERPSKGGGQRKLEDQVLMAGWTAPTTNDSKQGAGASQDERDGLTMESRLVGWAAPKASGGSGGRTTETEGGGNVHLDKQARLTVSGQALTGYYADGRTVQVPNGAQLSPSHSRWLMGLPKAWDECAIASFKPWRKP